jgi:RNA polymerase sigma-70 factor (ECF subfamily)
LLQSERARTPIVTVDLLVTQAGVGRYARVDAAIERELVTRLRGGDATAFDEIYTWMRPRVFSFLARMTGRRDVADDLSQEVWLRLARTGPKLAPDTRLAAWLFTVARNLYVSHWRAHQVSAQLAGGLLPIPPSPPSPFEAAAETQTGARVERAITALPEAYREILLLCAVEGLAPKDAAVVLGISGEAARQRLARARQMIDRALGELPRYPGGPT